MTPSDTSVCAWCEEELDTRSREAIRFSNTQPPWRATRPATYGLAGVAAAAASSVASALAVVNGRDAEPEIEWWFHRRCWLDLKRLLRPG